MKPKLAREKFGKRGLLVLVVLAVAPILWAEMTNRSGNVLGTVKTKGFSARDPRRESPPLNAPSSAAVEEWFTRSGWPWLKQEIVVRNRKLLCVDFVPYSGQPARHLFVYQVLEDNIMMLFASVVWNPPKQGIAIRCTYDDSSDSLVVSVASTNCFTLRLTHLWCN